MSPEDGVVADVPVDAVLALLRAASAADGDEAAARVDGDAEEAVFDGEEVVRGSERDDGLSALAERAGAAPDIPHVQRGVLADGGQELAVRRPGARRARLRV